MSHKEKKKSILKENSGITMTFKSQIEIQMWMIFYIKTITVDFQEHFCKMRLFHHTNVNKP